MVYQRILVAFDGSDLARAAFKKAVNIAKEMRATLDIIAVIDNHLLKDVSSFDTDYLHQISDGVSNQLSSLVDEAKAQQVTAGQYVKLGNPKVIISQDAFTQPHDLIILGATGMSKVEKIFIGSVTEYVIDHASSSCLIVKK